MKRPSLVSDVLPNIPPCDLCPIEHVSFNDVKTYVMKLNQLTGQRYRLPTESEWEYACRAHQSTTYCGSNDVDAVAWYGNNSDGKAHPVGQKKPNDFGLYDMSGNAEEWTCSDYINDGYEGHEKTCISSYGKSKVTRGGWYVSGSRYSRSASRGFADHSMLNYGQGFRLAID
jgi:formylglycine-generating enzyme required for sulfatase activity